MRAVDEGTRTLAAELSADDQTIVRYMRWAPDAFWQPTQIAPGIGLSVIRVRTCLRGLEDRGCVERLRRTSGSETQFRLTNTWEESLKAAP